jgi:hypothetical protein
VTRSCAVSILIATLRITFPSFRSNRFTSERHWGEASKYAVIYRASQKYRCPSFTENFLHSQTAENKLASTQNEEQKQQNLQTSSFGKRFNSMIFNAPDVTTVFHDRFSMVSHQLHQVFAGALWYSHNNLLIGRHVGCCTNLSQGHKFNRRLRWSATSFEGKVSAF